MSDKRESVSELKGWFMSRMMKIEDGTLMLSAYGDANNWDCHDGCAVAIGFPPGKVFGVVVVDGDEERLRIFTTIGDFCLEWDPLSSGWRVKELVDG